MSGAEATAEDIATSLLKGPCSKFFHTVDFSVIVGETARPPPYARVSLGTSLVSSRTSVLPFSCILFPKTSELHATDWR